MQFSIAPVEIHEQMHRQFANTNAPRRLTQTPRRTTVRRRVSLALHGLATRLEPTSTAA